MDIDYKNAFLGNLGIRFISNLTKHFQSACVIDYEEDTKDIHEIVTEKDFEYEILMVVKSSQIILPTYTFHGSTLRKYNITQWTP